MSVPICKYSGKKCLVQQCPYCEFKTMIMKSLEGHVPVGMEISDALRYGKAWYDTRTTYEFVACKREIDENVNANGE